MDKLKWKYDKIYKTWSTEIKSDIYGDGCAYIRKMFSFKLYELTFNDCGPLFFEKFKSAKEVARLMIYG